MNDFELHRLKLAFAHAMVGQIIDADGVVEAGELAFLAAHFPKPHLMEAGLVGIDGRFTDSYNEAVEQALAVLSEVMSHDEKRSLLQTLYRATVSDGHFDPREGNVLAFAGSALGVGEDALADMLDGIDSVGDVDLPEPT